jgi:hypothetical protein
MVLPKVQVSCYKVKRWHHICFYFAAGSPKKSFYWGVLDVPKLFVMGQSIWQKKGEKVVCASMNKASQTRWPWQ